MNFQQRAPAGEDLLDMANRLKDLLVLVVDLRDKHRMRCAPLQAGHDLSYIN
jgi:hypothetical protein